MALHRPSVNTWEELRPLLTEWYKSSTAGFIAERLRREYRLHVTPKMLRDRFKKWEIDRKYTQPSHSSRHREGPRRTASEIGNCDRNRAIRVDGDRGKVLESGEDPTSNDTDSDNFQWQMTAPLVEYDVDSTNSRQHVVIYDVKDRSTDSLPSSLVTPTPSRAPNTPQEDWYLCQTLAEIGRYLDCLIDTGSWRQRREEPAFAVQKLAADAHLAISGQKHDSHQIWRELGELYNPVAKTMPKLAADDLTTMHPRTLSALLRLVVDGSAIAKAMPLWEAAALDAVKGMFATVTSWTFKSCFHPVRLLCHMPKERTVELLFQQLTLTDRRLFDPLRQQSDGGVFAAQEQIYIARVLASLGYFVDAEFRLEQVVGDLTRHDDSFTKAEALRTLAYMRQQSCTSLADESEIRPPLITRARNEAEQALDLFHSVGCESSDNAMYTHICIAQLCEKQRDDGCWIHHVRKALSTWERNRGDQGKSFLIRDLHKALTRRGELAQAKQLQDSHRLYFEESHDYGL